jgi:hypothetical protein
VTDKTQFKLGDIVEVVYRKNVVGYLYKETEDRIFLSSTTEVEDGTPLKVIMKRSIDEVSSFSGDKPRVKEESKPDEMGKVIEFPSTQITDGDGA